MAGMMEEIILKKMRQIRRSVNMMVSDHPWWTWCPDTLTDEECDQLTKSLWPLFVQNKEEFPITQREISMPGATKIPEEIAEKMHSRARRANEEKWNLDIEINDYLSYKSRYEVGSFLGWHLDSRACKLSASIQLSSPNDYEGGDLQLMVPGAVNELKTITMPKERGTMVIFPSWTWHRVTEITEGERWSYVLQVTGPALR